MPKLIDQQQQQTASHAVNANHVQCKLTVGSINDPLEHEADAMADKVMRMPEQGLIQRKCAHCEEEEKAQRKPLSSFIQRKESAGESVVSEGLNQQINSSKGSGNKMDEKTESFMENSFGADFGDVKIHTNDEAAHMNRDLSARAFTIGNDIYFNHGQYQPSSEAGKHLLAHELTHTLQQANTIQREPQVNIDQHSAGITLPIGDFTIAGRLDEPLNLITDATGVPLNIPLSSIHFDLSYLDHCATGTLRGFKAGLGAQQTAGNRVADLKKADKSGSLIFRLVVRGRHIDAGAEVTVPADPSGAAPTFFIVVTDNGPADPKTTLPDDCYKKPPKPGAGIDKDNDNIKDHDGGGDIPPRRIGCASIDCTKGPTMENFLEYHRCCKSKTPPTPQLTQHTIYFYYDTPYFKEASGSDLLHLFDTMKMLPSVHVLITGHTSLEGTEDYNQDLSKKRADAVKNYLVMRGIESSRVDVFAMGENAPAVAEPPEPKPRTLRMPGGESVRDLNRRAEIVFFDPSGQLNFLPRFAPFILTAPDLTLSTYGRSGRRKSFLESQLTWPGGQ